MHVRARRRTGPQKLLARVPLAEQLLGRERGMRLALKNRRVEPLLLQCALGRGSEVISVVGGQLDMAAVELATGEYQHQVLRLKPLAKLLRLNVCHELNVVPVGRRFVSRRSSEAARRD